MRPRPVFVVSLAAIAVGAVVMVPAASAYFSGEADTPATTFEPGSAPEGAGALGASPGRLTAPGEVVLDTDDFWAWAMVDLATGAVTGSANMDATSTTASMIKAWLAADFLRLAAEAGDEPRPQRLDDIRVMIRDSENDPATRLYDELGGDESINRLIDICGLTDSEPSWRWSLTRLSARDAARTAACIADGRAAGPEWTEWLLNEMRQVRGEGDFGIRKAFPPDVADEIAIKNGYFARPEDGLWHLNCLATGHGWAMAVIQRYPEQLGKDHGAANCRSISEQLRQQ